MFFVKKKTTTKKTKRECLQVNVNIVLISVNANFLMGLRTALLPGACCEALATTY